MKYTYLIISLLYTSYIFSQEITVVIVDNVTKETLPFCNINIPNKNWSQFSNAKGIFYLNNNKADSIQISHLGYKIFKTKISDIKDTIKLIPKLVLLDEIIISSNKKKQKKEIGFFNRDSYLTNYLRLNTEFITLIKPENNLQVNSIINEVKFRIKINKDLIDSISPFFKLHIYKNINGFPEKDLLNEPILHFCNKETNNKVVIPISNEKIILNKEGVFIGLEFLGTIDKKGIKNYNQIDPKKTLNLFALEFSKKIKNTLTYGKNHFLIIDNKWIEFNKTLRIGANIFIDEK
ncbi:carboxypeptidase-like regulatory domain-containing protein [Polaribacter sp.]|uniref:carboxypeptidase-like regulatory domain-containing protein n=1 Tax=Polaribacter sp. TaxID=1920175 RepID=UPI0040472B75